MRPGPEHGQMEYRVLGRTGLRVSALGIGSWQLGGTLRIDGRPDGYPDPGEAAVIDLVRGVGDLGVNLVDTAPVYGDGEAERRVGRAVRPDRDRWVLCTKFGVVRGTAGERVVDAGAPAIRPSLEGSLKRLGTDRVELFLYHAPPEGGSVDGGREVLEALRQEGKLRHWGISTNDPAVLLSVAEDGGAEVVLTSQSMHTQPAALGDVARAHGLGVLARGALERGRLAGPPRRYGGDDFRSRLPAGEADDLFTAYAELCPPGASMVAFALRVVLDYEGTHSVLLGGRTLEQYREALASLALPPLAEATHTAVRRLRQRLREGSPVERLLGRARLGARRLLGSR